MSAQDLELELATYEGRSQVPVALLRRYRAVVEASPNRGVDFWETQVPLLANRMPTLLKMMVGRSAPAILDSYLAELEGVQSGRTEADDAHKRLATLLHTTYVKDAVSPGVAGR